MSEGTGDVFQPQAVRPAPQPQEVVLLESQSQALDAAASQPEPAGAASITTTCASAPPAFAASEGGKENDGAVDAGAGVASQPRIAGVASQPQEVGQVSEAQASPVETCASLPPPPAAATQVEAGDGVVVVDPVVDEESAARTRGIPPWSSMRPEEKEDKAGVSVAVPLPSPPVAPEKQEEKKEGSEVAAEVSSSSSSHRTTAAMAITERTNSGDSIDDRGSGSFRTELAERPTLTPPGSSLAPSTNTTNGNNPVQVGNPARAEDPAHPRNPAQAVNPARPGNRKHGGSRSTTADAVQAPNPVVGALQSGRSSRDGVKSVGAERESGGSDGASANAASADCSSSTPASGAESDGSWSKGSISPRPAEKGTFLFLQVVGPAPLHEKVWMNACAPSTFSDGTLFIGKIDTQRKD